MKRIRILAFILCACFVSAAWSQKITCPASVNWTGFHTIDMMRWNPCEKVLNVNNGGSLQLLWKHKTGSIVESSPAVVNGVVYIGSDDNNLYALNAKTGALLWSYTTGNTVASSPAVANRVVYVVLSSPAVANGVVYVGSYDNNIH